MLNLNPKLGELTLVSLCCCVESESKITPIPGDSIPETRKEPNLKAISEVEKKELCVEHLNIYLLVI